MSAYLLGLLTPLVRGYLGFALIIGVGEVIFHFIFAFVSWLFGLVHPGIKIREVFKGIVERTMVSIGLAHGILTVVIAFGALKVATKLSLSATTESEQKISNHNDYFLIGNSMSLLFAIIYALIAIHLKFVSIKI